MEGALIIELGSKISPEAIEEIRSERWHYKVWHDREEGNVPMRLEKMYERMKKNHSLACVLMGEGDDLDDSTEVTCEGHKRRLKRRHAGRYSLRPRPARKTRKRDRVRFCGVRDHRP